jgi:pimeloyl-ACP methyl ester carboxylesterase
MLIEGKGNPIVVFEAGLGGIKKDWQKVQSEVSKFTRTVAYDRAGLDESEDFTSPRTARDRAIDLHTALQNAKLPPPYILVGQSAGGPYIRVFAHLFPEEVAGMVFVDASHEDFFDYLKANLPIDWKKYQAVIIRGLLDQELLPAIRDEIQSFEGDLLLAREAWPLPNVPVISITAMHHPEVSKEALQIWLFTQQAWAARFPQGKHIQADNSGHDIQNEDPDLVIDAIRKVVEIARKE